MKTPTSSRVSFFTSLTAYGACSAAWLASGVPARAAGSSGAGVAPDLALARLMKGNETYVREMTGSRVNTIEERVALGKGQAPWASILTCADSRMSPEILFNQGLGDIFVVRVAGNVAGTDETSSLQYASAVLGSQLIVVMGHSGCGAVDSALAYAKGKTMPTPELEVLVKAIQPAVERAKAMHGNELTNAIKANAVIAASYLQGNALLKETIRAKKLEVVPAYCDLATGKVTWL